MTPQIALLRVKHSEHGTFTAGARAASVLLAGFSVEVDARFAAAEQKEA